MDITIDEVDVDREPRKRPQPRRRRLHEEILAPVPHPLTPAAMRRAKAATAILLLIALLAQPLSIYLGRWLEADIKGGSDAYSQWQAYLSHPAPDVLFLGASETYTDIDAAQLSAGLSSAAGHRVTVGKLGFIGQEPAFHDLAMHLVMRRSSRPKVVVVAVQAPMLNAAATCRSCTDPFTSDVWQISDLSDPGFIQLALNNDPNRLRLAAGWAIPLLANYPSIVGLQCPMVSFGREASRAVLGWVPNVLQAPTYCESNLPYRLPRDSMTEATYANTMLDYQQAFIRHLVREAQAGGTQVLFLKPPFHSAIRTAAPQAEQMFDAQLDKMSAELGVGIVDLSSAVPDDPGYWLDPLHLNNRGAHYYGPRAVQALASPLTSLGA